MNHFYELRSSGYAQKVLEGLQDLYASELCMDVELEDSAGEVVKAHMLVLASVSPFLKSYAQTSQNHSPTRLLFRDVTALQWQQILRFLYTGELTVELNQVEELCNVVAGIQIPELEALLKEAKEHMPQEPEAIFIQPQTDDLDPEDPPATSLLTLPPPQIRKNTRARLPLCPAEKFQGPFGEVEVGNVHLSESEKLLKINQAFGHVTVQEDAILSLQEELTTCGQVEEKQSETEEEEATENMLNVESSPTAMLKPKEELPEKAFRCNMCDALLAYGEELDSHLEAHMKVKEEFACSKCNKSFISEDNLEKHDKKMHKKKIEQCRFCSRVYSFQHLVDKHIIREHLELSGLDLKAFECDQCEETFATKVLLNYHKKRSHIVKSRKAPHEPKPCPLCQTVTPTLATHMKMAHPSSPAYQCSHCSEMFVKLRTRKTHIEKHHRQVRCKYCGKGLTNHELLLKHLPLCDKAPESHREAWSRKIKDSHTRIYNCSQCTLKFKALNHLRKHEKDAHGTYQQLQCHICLKKMSSSCAFKDHVMRHLGLRPFTCPHCPKKFTSSSDRTRHIRNMHTSTPAYQCHLCQKAFRDCSNFYAHGKKAHGENFRGLIQKARKMDHVVGTPPQLTSVAKMKVTDLIDKIKKECSGSHKDPGVCPICNKLFTKRSNLFTHGRKLHKINFTHLLKGRYSKYTYLGEIIKNAAQDTEQDDAEEDIGPYVTGEMSESEEDMELKPNVELLPEGDGSNVIPENYESIEMIEVENMDEAFNEDAAIVVHNQDGTVMHVYEMPQVDE